MDSEITPRIEVEIRGKKHQLRYTYGDFSAAQRELRRQGFLDELEGLAENSQKGKVDTFQAPVLLFIGLLHGWPGLKFSDCEQMVTWENVLEISTKTSEAFRAYVSPIIAAANEQSGEPEAAGPRPFPANGGDSTGPKPDTISASATENSGG